MVHKTHPAQFPSGVPSHTAGLDRESTPDIRRSHSRERRWWRLGLPSKVILRHRAVYGNQTHHLESRVSGGLADFNNLTASFVALPKTVSNLVCINGRTVVPEYTCPQTRAAYCP